jgi:hypothetical protein
MEYADHNSDLHQFYVDYENNNRRSSKDPLRLKKCESERANNKGGGNHANNKEMMGDGASITNIRLDRIDNLLREAEELGRRDSNLTASINTHRQAEQMMNTKIERALEEYQGKLVSRIFLSFLRAEGSEHEQIKFVSLELVYSVMSIQGVK